MSYPITEKLLPVNRHSRPGTLNQKITGLVIHWTANTAAGADALHNNMYFANLSHQTGDGTYASAHYNVDDHSIYRNVPEHEMAYHVGAVRYNPNTLKLLNTTYPNNCTIGIEWCVNSGNDFNETWKRVAWLAADICKRYGIDPMTHMIRHYDVTWKDCPHFFTPNVANGEAGWAKFRASVKALMGNSSPAPTPSISVTAIHETGVVSGTGNTGLHLRTAPNMSGSILDTLPEGAKLEITGTSGGWLRVSYQGKTGFVSGIYVKVDKPAPAPVAKPAPAAPAPVKPTPAPVKPTPAPAPAKPAPVVTPAPAKPEVFADIKGHWAEEPIQHLLALGVLTPSAKFNPDAPATRAQIATLVSRALKLLGK